MPDDERDRERRRTERVAVNAEFAAMPSMVYVSDVSEHGVFVHTERLVPVGTALQVRFTVLLDDPVVITARGRVVRHQADPKGVGIQFTQLEPVMVLRLEDIVAKQRPRDLLVTATAAESMRRTSPPPPPPGGTTRVTRPPTAESAQPESPPEVEEFDASQTLVKLQAVDVEILDDDDEFEDDPGTSGPRGPHR